LGSFFVKFTLLMVTLDMALLGMSFPHTNEGSGE
jgi:hypothetical protein